MTNQYGEESKRCRLCLEVSNGCCEGLKIQSLINHHRWVFRYLNVGANFTLCPACVEWFRNTPGNPTVSPRARPPSVAGQNQPTSQHTPQITLERCNFCLEENAQIFRGLILAPNARVRHPKIKNWWFLCSECIEGFGTTPEVDNSSKPNQEDYKNNYEQTTHNYLKP